LDIAYPPGVGGVVYLYGPRCYRAAWRIAGACSDHSVQFFTSSLVNLFPS